jgi:hypothetical protein
MCPFVALFILKLAVRKLREEVNKNKKGKEFK